MKCSHKVRSYQWVKCPKCNKYVRRKKIRDNIILCMLVLFMYFAASRIADWILDIAYLSEYNPYNITHAAICVALGLFVYLLLHLLIPAIYEESENIRYRYK